MTRPSPLVWMTIALWVAAFLVLTYRASLMMEGPQLIQYPPRLFSCAIGALLCWLLSFALRRFNHWSLASQLALGFVASIFTGIIYGGLTAAVFRLMLPSPGGESPLWMDVMARAQAYLWIFISWCFAYLALSYSEQSRENQMRLMEAQTLAADAQNRMLRYQVNPHFLFNTLNALQTLLLDRKTGRARAMVQSLADFLRYSLAREPDEMVTLGEEAEAQSAYLAIEEARFGDQVKFVCEIDSDARNVRVPSLILQPLIENAVKYAVTPSTGTVTISLTARLTTERVRIEVRDDGHVGAPVPSKGLKVGLENVRRRLELAYGGQAEFTYGPMEPKGFVVIILLPRDGV
ncbi:sensor histidine kinase [Brevundimonas sp.]|uniref:sensor histidine kinase n=1 Tax=Brevundimonas sp. TaxID=1871086 RepID=UPI002D5494BC|nr:histidine kinase [Brevundimonas sp.]HYC74838.1 histidine kinase [Brevundimonas sp.]